MEGDKLKGIIPETAVIQNNPKMQHQTNCLFFPEKKKYFNDCPYIEANCQSKILFCRDDLFQTVLLAELSRDEITSLTLLFG